MTSLLLTPHDDCDVCNLIDVVQYFLRILIGPILRRLSKAVTHLAILDLWTTISRLYIFQQASERDNGRMVDGSRTGREANGRVIILTREPIASSLNASFLSALHSDISF